MNLSMKAKDWKTNRIMAATIKFTQKEKLNMLYVRLLPSYLIIAELKTNKKPLINVND